MCPHNVHQICQRCSQEVGAMKAPERGVLTLESPVCRRDGAGGQPGSHGNDAGDRGDHCSGARDPGDHSSGAGEASLTSLVDRCIGAGEGHSRELKVIDIGEVDGDSDSSSVQDACVLFLNDDDLGVDGPRSEEDGIDLVSDGGPWWRR